MGRLVDGKPLPGLLLCVGLVVSLFGLSLVPSMELDGIEYLFVGYLFVVPGTPYFLLGVAARHLRSERDRKALIGAFAGMLPTILVYAPLLQEHPRDVDGPLAAGMYIYWLPLVLPVTASIGVASALLWPTLTRAADPAKRQTRRAWAWTEDPRPVAWRSSFLLATLGIVLGVGFSIATWLALRSRPVCSRCCFEGDGPSTAWLERSSAVCRHPWARRSCLWIVGLSWRWL